MNIVHIFGGLGNQMFQYAFFKYLVKLGVEASINTGYFNNNQKKVKHSNNFLLPDIFPGKILEKPVENIQTRIMYGDKLIWQVIRRLRKIYYRKENVFQTYKLISNYELHDTNNDVCSVNQYRGYWQETRFLDLIEDEIRTIFSFDTTRIGDRNHECIRSMSSANSVAIHVRRGDYLKLQDIYGNICTPEYYLKGISLIEQRILKPHYYIFSDDIEWCKEHFAGLVNKSFIDWNNSDNSYIDMLLMSSCKHNIIANSSFSWWAAWLNSNKQKVVIMPKKWTINRTSEQLQYKNCTII